MPRSGTKRALTSNTVLEGDWQVDKVVGMVRRGGSNHIAIRWSGYGPEGDTWELESNVYPASKINDFKENVQTELGMNYVRQGILNTMLGKTIRDRVPRYRYLFDVPQVCYDEVGVSVVKAFGALPGVSYATQKEPGAVRHFSIVQTLEGAAAFLLGHVVRPDVATGSLRITGGRACFLDMTKLLPGSYIEYVCHVPVCGVPSFKTRKAVVSINTCTFNGLTGTPHWPMIPPGKCEEEDERFALSEMDAIVQHAKRELRQKWSVLPVSHPLRSTWAVTPTGPSYCERGWSLMNAI